MVGELPSEDEVFDVCIVGSGPAGLAVALALEARGRSAIVLEAGGLKTDSLRYAAPGVRIESSSLHAPLEVSTRQRLGGTSFAWGTLCVPLDPIDFLERDWIAHSGWPIPYAEIGRRYAEAARFLGCGAGEFEHQPVGTLDMRTGCLANQASLMRLHKEQIRNSSRLKVLLHAPVSSIVLDETGSRVVAVCVERNGGYSQRIRARRFVLAGGGLRTTHLLLLLARQWPRHFADGRAPLGRFYMGHLTGEIATMVFRSPSAAEAFLYRKDPVGIWVQRRIQPSMEAQYAGALSNTAFTLRPPPLANPNHRSGALSLLYLSMRVPWLARRVRSQRLTSAGRSAAPGDVRRHLVNVVSHPAETARDLAELLGKSRHPNLPVMAVTASGRYSLRFHAEQLPNPNSFVALASDTDVMNIHFRYLEADFRSVVKAHEVLDAALRSEGYGHLDYLSEPDKRLDEVAAQASDGYHQIGTTRMGKDPRSSVVDENCRVHGIHNLFVASSSVFPTSGSANPTFPIVALAIRLASHLAKQGFSDR